MSEVVRIHGGGPVTHPGNPDTDIVAAIEGLLEKARSGEIVGVAYAYRYFDGASGGNHAGEVSYPQIGRMVALTTRMARLIDE